MTSAYPDDDDSARRRPTSPSGSSGSAGSSDPKPTATPTNVALTWGILGTSNRVEPLTIVPGATGIVRLLPNDIRYHRPPSGMAWSEITAEPGRFEMVWPGDPTTARSLADLAAAARQARQQQGPLPLGHPTLTALDEAVFALAVTVHDLQSQDWGVGLLTPANVILSTEANKTTATLVDLGFTWIGDFGDPPWDASPGRPDWLEPSEVRNPSRVAWVRPPAEQQFAQATGGLFQPSLESDLGTLSRVIAWALTGTPSPTLPSRDSSAEFWSVLQEMLDGRVTTASAALRQLRAHPPSGLFLAAPAPIELIRDESSPKPKSSRAATIGGIVAVLGVLAAAAGYGLFGTAPTPAPATPGTEQASTSTPPATTTTDPAPTPASPKVTDYASIPSENVAERIAKFRDLAASARDPESIARAGEMRVKLFSDWIDKCEVHATDTDPARRAEAGAKLRELIDAYFQLNRDHPPTDPKLRDQEQQWLEQYDRQAELLGWPRYPS
ncbi:MAG: hypothetical protein LC104_11875 [Bacteroidales bacterium]|nr:hypothetical protein [Bacteroidales bacterium]